MLKKLLLNLVILSIATLLICVAILKLMPPKEDNYMYALKDKHTRLASLKGPKLIIVGGSNTAFGVDSELLEKELQMPVVNMGIHVGLRLEYMLNEVKPAIGEGDLVVLLPEYTHLYYNVDAGFTKAFYRANEVFPEAMNYIQAKKIPNALLQTYTDLLQTKLKVLLIPTGAEQSKHVIRNKKVYRRQSFNKQGDMVAHLTMSPQGFLTRDDTFDQFLEDSISPEFFTLTNEFNEFTKSKGGHFMMSLAPTPQSVYLDDVGGAIKVALEKNADYPILGSPGDFVYEDNMFFDTRYHLIKESRYDRTKKLANLIKNQRDN